MKAQIAVADASVDVVVAKITGSFEIVAAAQIAVIESRAAAIVPAEDVLVVVAAGRRAPSQYTALDSLRVPGSPTVVSSAVVQQVADVGQVASEPTLPVRHRDAERRHIAAGLRHSGDLAPVHAVADAAVATHGAATVAAETAKVTSAQAVAAHW